MADDEPGDRRKHFEELTRRHPADPDAARAFLAARIEMIRGDARMTPEEKERAIAELRERLSRPERPDGG